ncbi:uncharacterized protein LOC126900338 [Daktulosphaira vitifoliae]|uniref:uncharacterized protein LOC126900338 n=1 Tax=Daktulosphaira vitifoliae TaxID=58002 RepID=UPI0021AA538A|nr:uncharacterized protein LOC126900338 [Daktulosphaira vitifoliae]XP_050531947.1 uncharacterized protein LOC126900338 [Daktulosphaira vitifoliae]
MSISQSDPGLPVIDQQNKKFTTIIIYPTVTPEKIIIPMVSCILGFPLVVLMVICCLRRRAKLARDRDRRRNLGFARACTSDQGVISLARFSPMHKIGVYLAAGASANSMSSTGSSGNGMGRTHPLRSESRSYASCDLDPVAEERSEMETSCSGAVDVLVCPDS